MNDEVERHLDKVTLDQMTWKPSITRAIAVRIAEAFGKGVVWPDEIDLTFVPKKDSKCIGTAWRNLRRAKIIHRTKQFRPSEKKGSKGRTVFCWQVSNFERLKRFLEANGGMAPVLGQQQFL